MSDQSWPVVLKSNELTLRPLRFRDRAKWFAVRAENREWLTPWEATLPQVPEHIDGAWRDHICFVKENPAVK